MPIKKGAILDLEISNIAFGGKGLTRVEGFTVFVDQTVPADRVKVRVVKKRKNYAEARVIELTKPSPLRIQPACKYSGHCGGCKWQFLPYEKQLAYKRQHVRESLEHIGRTKGVPVHPVIPSEQVFGYRNKMEFSCSDRRWLLPDEMDREDVDKGVAIGLHVPGAFFKVLDIDACLIQPSLGNQILADVRSFVRGSGAPVYGLHSHVGFWRFLMLRHSAAYDQWMVNLITATEDPDVVRPLGDLLMEKYPNIVSVVNNITSRKAGIAVGEYEIPLAGESVLRDKIGPFEFEISANSFFQTNTRSAAHLYETVKRYANLTGEETVLDLYSGTGTIPLYLSGSAKAVTGMEIVESAVADAEKNCRLNQVSNCQFVQGDVRHALSEMNRRPDVMIIDPPRNGMHKDVVRQVLTLAPPRIVYVSCNPATLARDVEMMKAHYHILEVQPVDMFPHTYHIESVARLEKR